MLRRLGKPAGKRDEHVTLAWAHHAQEEAIAAVEGVDVVFAGPTDLAAALGHIGNNGHPEVRRVLKEIPGRVAREGKAAGIAITGYEAAELAFRQGYRFISFADLLWFGSRGIARNFA